MQIQGRTCVIGGGTTQVQSGNRIPPSDSPASSAVSYADPLPLTRRPTQTANTGGPRYMRLTKITAMSTSRQFLVEIFNTSTFVAKFSTFPLGGKLDSSGHVREAGEMKLVGDLDRTRGTAAVLAENDFGRAGVGVVLFEGVRTMQEHDNVGVLLERA